jgi:ABC-type dipeptide/oligopeptide/nickel transport system permease component
VAGYALRRLLGLVGILFGISVVTFGLTAVAPGDPAYAVLALEQPGSTPSDAAVELMRSKLGLDQPAAQRYLHWLTDVVRGDFGLSYRSGQPVAAEIAGRLPATLTLAGASLALAAVLGLPVGVLAARRVGSGWDTASRVLAVLGATTPTYVLSSVLVLVFSVQLNVLPAFGSRTALHFVLPAVALSAGPLAQIARLSRASLLEVGRQDYLRAARARGLSPLRVTLVHASRIAAPPVLTVTGLTAGQLLGGAVIVETIFSWNGVGKYAVDAIFLRDYPAIQGVVLYAAAAVALVNFAVDLIYPLLDPRLTRSGTT